MSVMTGDEMLVAIEEATKEIVRLHGINTQLYTAAKGVIAAFDAGAFVRSTANDNDPAWAIKLLPHLRALTQLSGAVHAIENKESK